MGRSLTIRIVLAAAVVFGNTVPGRAACVTAAQITDAVTRLNNANYQAATVASRISLVTDLFQGLRQIEPADLKFAPPIATVQALATRLNQDANQKEFSDRTWEERVAPASGSAAQNKVMKRVQEWADWGEMVVMVDDQDQIGIVVPVANATTGVEADGPWKDVLIPHVALVNPSPADAMKFEVYRDVPLKQIVTDPGTLKFYRFAK